MIKRMLKTFNAALVVLLTTVGFANAQEIEMADKMRSEGKIYVVIVVASIALTILSIYMFRIDRKVSKLERERKD